MNIPSIESLYATILTDLDEARRQRNASNRKIEELTDALDNAGMISESSNRWQEMMTALREAKEALNEITDVFANIGMTSGIYDDEQESLKKACEAIATINKVLGEE